MKIYKQSQAVQPLRLANRPLPLGEPTDDSANCTLIVGLDILEFLAARQQPATVMDICERLQMTGSAVYRSLKALEARGYICWTQDKKRYLYTGRPFQLRTTAPSTHRLLTHAGPIMQSLSEAIRQSCNIALPTGQDMQVVAQQETPAAFGVTVPLGYVYDIPNSAPGIVFAAFATKTAANDKPQHLPSSLPPQAWSSLEDAITTTLDRGVARLENALLPDVTDLSCPVYENGEFVAALTVPFLQMRSGTSMTWCLAALQSAAEELSRSLRGGDLVA